MSEYAILSSGDPEKDREALDRFAQMDARLDAGNCPNNCQPLVWDDPYNAQCPECNFHWGVNVPYGKKVENELVN